MPFGCPHCQKDIADYIPKKRLDEVIAERDGFETQAKLADKHARELESQKAENGRLRLSMKLTDAGVSGDEDVRGAFIDQYGRATKDMAAKDKPEIDAWVKGLTEKPDTAPMLLKHFLPKAAAPAAGGAPAQPGAAPAAPAAPPNPGAIPDSDRHAGTAGGGAAPTLTAEAVDAMTDEQFLANLPQIGVATGRNLSGWAQQTGILPAAPPQAAPRT